MLETAPYTFIFKSNRGELAGTHHKDCNNPVSFDNKILVCQDFSIRNPKLGLIMRNLSPLNQFAQINLIILPLNQSKGSIGNPSLTKRSSRACRSS